MKPPNRKKLPPGWKARVGAFVGHGVFIGHFVNPDGFKFSNEMHQCLIKPGETPRDLVVARAWEVVDLAEKYRKDQAKLK